MKDLTCTAFGIIGSAITTALGGWTSGMLTLIIFMTADYITGLICAGVFKVSKKTKNGGLESRVGWKGICRKGVTLMIVFIAYRLDLLIGTTYIKDAVIIGFCVNELISITENCGLMGIPLPTPIVKAIDILKSKGSDE